MKCKKCKNKMGKGKALLESLTARLPDFGRMSATSRGQTLFRSGHSTMVNVHKCHKCGYSHT